MFLFISKKGGELWISVQDQIDFVLSRPNGWEGTQQNEMRRAAAFASFTPNTTAGHGRLSFVTEGEAFPYRMDYLLRWVGSVNS